MFKEITKGNITAVETKKRILAYVYGQLEPELSSDKYWRGSIDTYTLNLRLSGIYGETTLTDDFVRDIHYQVSSAKYLYLVTKTFIKETQYLDSARFVRFVYQTFLGREVDPGGFAANLQQLKHGISRINLVNRIRNSEEAQNFFLNLTDCFDDQYFFKLVRRIYLTTNHADPTLPANIFASQCERSRKQILQELHQFQQLQAALKQREQDFGLEDSAVLQSSEQLSNEDFIKQLYGIYLKREADLGGLQSQLKQLDSGTERGEILYNLRTSTEAINTFVNLTSNLNNLTFLELVYCIYHREKLPPEQNQRDLEKLESGLMRQQILSDSSFDLINQEQAANSSLVNQISTFDEEKKISLSDRHIILQKWQVSDAEFLQRNDGLENSEFIDEVYQFFLLRKIEPEEFADHQKQFAKKISRLDLLNQVRRSPKAATLFLQLTQDLDDEKFLDIVYVIYFHKELDPEDKLVYLQFLKRGNPRTDILA